MSNRYYYIYFLLIILLCSCNDLVLKKDKKTNGLKENWSSIDSTKVEEPPLFDICKHESEEGIELCFHKTINNHITKYLSEHTITVTEAINDTVWVPLLITIDNEIILENFIIPEIITAQIPDFRNILEESINSLPKIEAAHTHSTPVTTRYKLPLVISIN